MLSVFVVGAPKMGVMASETEGDPPLNASIEIALLGLLAHLGPSLYEGLGAPGI